VAAETASSPANERRGILAREILAAVKDGAGVGGRGDK